MAQPDRISDVPRVQRRRPVHPLLWTVAGICLFIELMGWLDDTRTLPNIPRWVLQTYFAFFDQSFEFFLETGTVRAQMVWSTVTYAFLHGGWLHVGMNMAAFLGIGHAISQMAGIRAVVAVFVVSSIAGALALGLISEVRGPLVGASGAVFGMLGVLTAWDERALRLQGRSRQPVWARIGGLVILNVILALGLGGMLAWEAHLGGFVAGWVMAYVYPPLPHRGPAFTRVG